MISSYDSYCIYTDIENDLSASVSSMLPRERMHRSMNSLHPTVLGLD